MQTTAAFIFDNIGYARASRPILEDLSLTVYRGEWFTLLGRSGVGKSTLGRIGAGLLAPNSGRMPRQGEGAIGFLAQSPGDIFIGATVFEEVAFGLRLQGMDDAHVPQRVLQVLQLVGLDHVSLGQPPTKLSGGQQQLLALAAVIAPQPSLLILDEPTSMLDHQAQLAVLRALRSIVQAGTGILHITHRSDEALWADRVGVLCQGKLAGSGAPMSLLSDPTLLRAAGAEPPVLLSLWQALQRNGMELAINEWSVAGMHTALTAYASAHQPTERT